MYWLDTTILILLSAGALLGFRSGLLWQIARILCLICATGATIAFNDQATNFYRDSLLQGADPRVAGVLAYVSVFLVTYFTLYWISRILHHIVRASDLFAFDRLLGAILGIVKASVLVASGAWVLASYPHPATSELMEKSKLAPIFADGMSGLWALLPQSIKDDVKDALLEMLPEREEKTASAG